MARQMDRVTPTSAATTKGASMRVLVTSSRNTFALDLIRKLGSVGHTVFASDTYDGAWGASSRLRLRDGRARARVGNVSATRRWVRSTHG